MNYLKSFIKEEDGMETIEFVVILAVVAGLIAIVARVGKSVKDRGDQAEEKVNDGLGELDQILGTGSSSGNGDAASAAGT